MRHTKKRRKSDKVSRGEGRETWGHRTGRSTKETENQTSEPPWNVLLLFSDAFSWAETGIVFVMLWVHLFLNLSCRQDWGPLESAALTMFHVRGGRRETKWVCGKWRKKVTWGRGRGIWQPSPDRGGKTARSASMHRSSTRGRTCEWTRPGRSSSRAASEQGVGTVQQQAANPASLGASEQCPEASRQRSQSKITHWRCIKHIISTEVNRLHNHNGERRWKLDSWFPKCTWWWRRAGRMWEEYA